MELGGEAESECGRALEPGGEAEPECGRALEPGREQGRRTAGRDLRGDRGGDACSELQKGSSCAVRS